MHNPFPGMNPYLEQPGLWPQIHNRLIVAIADDITPRLPPGIAFQSKSEFTPAPKPCR